MDTKERKAPAFTHHLWIDDERKIISFHEEKDCPHLGFYSLDSMMAYVLEKGRTGYRIQ